MGSVTRILAKVGIIDTDAPYFTDEARDRGTAVHKATEMVDDDTLDWGSIEGDELMTERVRGYEQWRKDMPHIRILYRELEVVSETFGYVGHIDIVAEDTQCERRSIWVIDIKPPGKSAWHGLQLAAYKRAFRETFPEYKDRPVKRFNLRLGGPRGHKLEPQTDTTDWGVFQASIIVAKFIERNQ